MTTEKARHVAELTRALKRIYWQGGTEYGSQWLAGELYDHGIRVQTTDPATAPSDAHTALGALRAVLTLEAPPRHPDTNPAVHKLCMAGWDAAMQAARDAITTALEGKK